MRIVCNIDVHKDSIFFFFFYETTKIIEKI